MLAAAVVILLLVDPLLVTSVGFWLSVGATAGVTIVGPPLRRRLARFGPLATPLAMSIAAQLGVLLPSVLVFGQFAVVGIVANLVAVPVAGLVMLYGLPASLVAGAVPALRGLLMAPVGVGDRWVDTVAAVAAALERRPPWNIVVAAVVLSGHSGCFAATATEVRPAGDNDRRMSVHVLTGDDESILRAAVNTWSTRSSATVTGR